VGGVILRRRGPLLAFQNSGRVCVAESQASDSTIMALAGHGIHISEWQRSGAQSRGFQEPILSRMRQKIGHSFLLRIDPKRLTY
jgi:hypothetical protein